jgi:hypothetical protein
MEPSDSYTYDVMSLTGPEFPNPDDWEILNITDNVPW